MPRILNVLAVVAALLFFTAPKALAEAGYQAEIEAAAVALADGFARDDHEIVARLINVELLLDRVFGGRPIEGSRDDQVRKGMVPRDLIEGIMRPLAGNRVAVLRVQSDGARGSALLRFSTEAGLSYMEFEFLRLQDGTQQIVDWVAHANATRQSEAFRQLLAFSMPDSSLMQRMVDAMGGPASDREKIVEAIVTFASTRDFGPFMQVFEQASEETKADLLLQKIYINAALQANDMVRYRAGLDLIARHHGDDPRLAFTLVDHYFFREEYDKAIQALNDFERFIDVEDAELCLIRANVLLMKGEAKPGLAEARRASAIDPTFEDAYWVELDAYSRLGRFDSAVDTIEVIEKQFGYRFAAADFSHDENFASLTESTEFAEWARLREGG